MLTEFDPPSRQIFWGNVLLCVCCVFYLCWWLLAFKPEGAIKGFKSGWLLIPAFSAGVSAVIFIIRGIGSAKITGEGIIPSSSLVGGGIAIYVILLLITIFLFKRPVTTELILIVGWAVLTLSEVNTLYGMRRFSCSAAMTFMVVTAVASALSLVCYVLYYNLEGRAGYLDGIAPLVMAALVMAAIAVCIKKTCI